MLSEDEKRKVRRYQAARQATPASLDPDAPESVLPTLPDVPAILP